MSEHEEYHDSHVGENSEGEEVVFKTTSSTSITAPSEMITKQDIQEVIEGWKIKFQKLTEGVRAMQIATEESRAHMDKVMRDSCARDDAQENRIQQMQEGLATFLERCDPAHPTSVRPFATPCAPTMSTPITPSGVLSRYRPDFPLASPVNQTAPTEPTRGNGGLDRSQRPTHEDEHGDSGDFQHPPTNNNSSGMNNSASRPSSSPKVPIFDGTTANMLIGMTMGQLDDYAFLVARLSHRYDPPEREEAHRAELRARIRRRNETADEFAENLKNLAQRAYTNADQSMLDNLVVERFREGHGNVELIYACVPQLDYRT